MACLAVVSIPQGVFSKPFRLCEISENSDEEAKFRGNVTLHFPLQVGVNPSGEMQPMVQVPSTVFWPKLIDLASDCHDQNVKLCRYPMSPGTLVLQTIREIPAGKSLQLWFSEELMISDLRIPPFLSPHNIKGENSYVCHECHEEFERPNLLKLHLALHCDRLSSDAIWTRLKKSKSQSSPILLAPSYLLSFSPTSSSTRSPYPLLPLSPTIASSTTSSSSLFRPFSTSPHYHHHSLINPPTVQHFNNNIQGFPSGLVSSTSTTASSSTPSPIIGVEAPVEVSKSSGELPVNTPSSTEVSTNGRNSLVIQEQHHHHARLEAIVSNMGKAKNGHVCLYCGKLYSRKYGLKIHIRTHTGYKPLRCKICHRPFGDPSNLNKHVRLHSDGSTPYRCELCRKVLVRRRDLDRHMRTRHNTQNNHQNGSSSRSSGNINGNGSLSAGGFTREQQASNRSATITSSMVSSSIM